jgi:hypothetical protein
MQFMTENKKRGRPSFKPTRRMRNTVEICVAGGLSLQETATVLGICQNTLRANFADELQNGRVRRFAEVLLLLDRAARRGSVGAMKFLFTVVSGGTSTVIGKKEFRQRAAADVLEGGSEWGDDLHPTTEKLQ